MNYKPFYSFKCYTKAPIIYLLPQYALDTIMYLFNSKSFYEYYFEPSGKVGMVFFQFYHSDFDQGSKAKSFMETLILSLQMFFILWFAIFIYFFMNGKKLESYKTIFIIVIFLFCTQIFNPLTTFYSKFKTQKQQLF